jgi:hypothetical protein
MLLLAHSYTCITNLHVSISYTRHSSKRLFMRPPVPEPLAPFTVQTWQVSMLLCAIPCSGVGGPEEGAPAEGGGCSSGKRRGILRGCKALRDVGLAPAYPKRMNREANGLCAEIFHLARTNVESAVLLSAMANQRSCSPGKAAACPEP